MTRAERIKQCWEVRDCNDRKCPWWGVERQGFCWLAEQEEAPNNCGKTERDVVKRTRQCCHCGYKAYRLAIMEEENQKRKKVRTFSLKPAIYEIPVQRKKAV